MSAAHVIKTLIWVDIGDGPQMGVGWIEPTAEVVDKWPL